MMRRVLAAVIGLWGALPLAAQEFTTLKGHGGPIMALAVAPEGAVTSGSFDNSVGLWQGRAPRWLEGHDAAVTALAYAPDGTLISAGDDFAVLRWQDGTARRLGQHQGKVAALAVSPDGQFVASGSWDGSVRLWSLGDAPAPAPQLPAPDSGVNALGFGPEGALFVGTTGGMIWRYALDGTPPRPLIKNGFGINELIAGPDWLAFGAVDGTTRVINPETGEVRKDFTLDRRPILSMAYHPGSARLAVGDGEGYIMVLDMERLKIAQDFRATRSGPVWALAYGLHGQMLWAGGIDDAVYGWPVAALDDASPQMGQERSFLRDASDMPNGERQFMRKCSICHALSPGPSRKAGPTLYGVFGRRAGSVPDYPYSPILTGSDIIWSDQTIDALFDLGPDHYIPGSKMPMQVIAAPSDRADLIAFLRDMTREE